MATTVKLKNSVTTTNAPISLQQGEVAINITDKKVWVGNAATTPVQLLGTGADGSFTNLEYSGTFTGGTGVITIGTDQFVKDASGNIGIGTATPSSTLDITHTGGSSVTIRGVSTDGARLKFFNNALTTGGFQLGQGYSDGSDNIAYVSNEAEAALIFRTFAAERMRIDSAGNVGIGTSSPSAKLQVVGKTSLGNQNITSGDAGIDFVDTAITGGNSIRWLDSSGYVANITQYSTGHATLANVMTINNSGGFRWSIGGTEQMRITSTGDVGIGISAPATKLHTDLFGATGITAPTAGNLVSYAGASNAASTGYGVALTNDNGNKTGYFGADRTGGDAFNGITVAATSNHPMRFLTNNTEKVRITTDGLLQFNSGYGSVATAYGCRAWVNFDGNTNNDQAGTYTQSGTTVIVTITGHGFTTGQVASLDFTSGTAVDGVYTITVTDANVFTVVQASRITTGIVLSKRKTIRASGNVSSVTDNATGDYSVNFTTAMPDANYAVNASLDNGSTSVGAVINIDRDAIATPLTTQSVRLQCLNTADTPVSLDSEFVCVTIFR